MLKGPTAQHEDLNASGDYEPCKDIYTGEVPMMPMPSPPDPLAIDEIVKFRNWIESRNGLLFIAFPPIADHIDYSSLGWRRDSARVSRDFKKLGFNPLGEPLLAVYPKTNFCNAHYHLNRDGAEIHTARLLSQLKAVAERQVPLISHR